MHLYSFHKNSSQYFSRLNAQWKFLFKFFSKGTCRTILPKITFTSWKTSWSADSGSVFLHCDAFLPNFRETFCVSMQTYSLVWKLRNCHINRKIMIGGCRFRVFISRLTIDRTDMTHGDILLSNIWHDLHILKSSCHKEKHTQGKGIEIQRTWNEYSSFW